MSRRSRLAGRLRLPRARHETTNPQRNISGTFRFPSANTTPGSSKRAPSRALAARASPSGLRADKTVVTNAFKGEDLNHYVPIFQRYCIPVRYNLQGRG